ncbi:MAG: sigma-70 family RNA polymerase sigma factor [Planctomycetota bacterium]
MPQKGCVDDLVGHLFRQASTEITAELTRQLGVQHLGLAEDVVQEALLKALRSWPFHGVPNNPKGWLRTVAKNAAFDRIRRSSRQMDFLPDLDVEARASEELLPDEVADSVLRMIFHCCNENLAGPSRVALTLGLVGGFSTGEISRALFAERATIQQRLVRAKRVLKEGEIPFDFPSPANLAARVDSVLDVIYLMFNAGYVADQGRELVRRDLVDEAMRLLSVLLENPAIASPSGEALAALMCFHAARLTTRSDEARRLQLLADQDRGRWDQDLIRRGFRHLLAAMKSPALSRFHLEAGIASCHAAAPSTAATDWPQILKFYDQLLALTSSPVVALNRCVAIAMARGPAAGFHEFQALEGKEILAPYLCYHVVRAELLSLAGNADESRAAFRLAASLAGSDPQREYLRSRIDGHSDEAARHD